MITAATVQHAGAEHQRVLLPRTRGRACVGRVGKRCRPGGRRGPYEVMVAHQGGIQATVGADEIRALGQRMLDGLTQER